SNAASILDVMKILGIESSCDETAAAIVEIDDSHNLTLLSNAVATSLDLHAQYGGVVPEIAARSHIESILPVIDEAIREAFVPNAETGERSVKREEPHLGANLTSPHSPLHTPQSD